MTEEDMTQKFMEFLEASCPEWKDSIPVDHTNVTVKMEFRPWITWNGFQVPSYTLNLSIIREEEVERLKNEEQMLERLEVGL
jgi:hypothetical protein